MVLKQKETSLDGLLLKVVYPLLFQYKLGRQLLRVQLWHQEELAHSDASNIVELVPRQSSEGKTQPVLRSLVRQKPAA